MVDEAWYDSAGGVCTKLADMQGTYSLVMDGLNALGILGGNDEIEKLGKAISQLSEDLSEDYAKIIGYERAEGIKSSWDTVNQIIGPSNDDITIIREFEPGDPRFDTYLFLGSLHAASQLGVDFDIPLDEDHIGDGLSFWSRPFYSEFAYKDNWNGAINPPTFEHAGGTFVVDYRFGLPYYLLAIINRLTVMVVLSPNWRNKFRPELDQFTHNLSTSHEKLRNSIVSLRTPRPCEIFGVCQLIKYDDGPKFQYFDYFVNRFTSEVTNSWNNNERVCGVVEVNTGVSRTSKYEEPLFDNPNRFILDRVTVLVPDLMHWEGNYPEKYKPEPPSRVCWMPYGYYPRNGWVINLCWNDNYYFYKFLPTLALRTLKHKRELYIFMGLPSVWQIIDKLRTITGNPPLDRSLNYSILSLRGAAQEINNYIEAWWGGPFPDMINEDNISIHDISVRLNWPAAESYPISFRKMLEEC